MRKIAALFVLLISVITGVFGLDRSVSQIIAGATSQGLEFPLFKAYQGTEKTVTTAMYLSFAGSFNYSFLKKVHRNYSIGFTASLGDTVSVGGFDPDIFIYFPFVIMTRLTPFYFFNRITQKIGFTSRIGRKVLDSFGIFESGMSTSFINFFGQQRYYEDLNNNYYLTFLMGIYFFIGYENHGTLIYGNPVKRLERSFIIGQFYEFNFDIGKYTGDFYTSMRYVYFYFSTGLELRFGVVK